MPVERMGRRAGGLKKIGKETWKPVVGYENLYSISSHGRVRREKKSAGAVVGRILKKSKNKDGYMHVSLGNGLGNIKTHKIANIVSRAFLGKKPKGLVVNHIDADRANDNIENLEYITQSENVLNAFRRGYKAVCGERNGLSKLKNKDIPKIRKMYPRHTQKEIADKFGVSHITISDIIRGVTWARI